jgi:uncharacterized repeat protein (TIGR03806 family)
MLRRIACTLLALLALASRAASPIPEYLSDYGVLSSDGKTLSLIGRTMPYDLMAPLFSDYALKFRTVTLPVGATVGYRAEDTLDFPIGTVISKTFYYQKDAVHPGSWLQGGKPDGGEAIDLGRYHLVETRILRRDTDGTWQANAYVWNEAQTEATLKRIGQVIDASLRNPRNDRVQRFSYEVPNARQCQACHAVDATMGQAGIQPIGPKARWLNADYLYAKGRENILQHMNEVAQIAGLPELAQLPKPIAYADPSHTIDARARSYLEVNCVHCHNAQGDARQSGLFLTKDAKGSTLGLCKQHVAAGAGGAGLAYDIVPGKPDQSLLISRLEASSGQGVMPRLGRHLVDDDGIALLKAWIEQMAGDCTPSHS